MCGLLALVSEENSVFQLELVKIKINFIFISNPMDSFNSTYAKGP